MFIFFRKENKFYGLSANTMAKRGNIEKQLQVALNEKITSIKMCSRHLNVWFDLFNTSLYIYMIETAQHFINTDIHVISGILYKTARTASGEFD